MALKNTLKQSSKQSGSDLADQMSSKRASDLWEAFGLPIISIIVSLLVVSVILLLIGENPLTAIYHLFFGVFGYAEGFGYSLYYSTNFIFTGLAVAIAFHAGLFNIGGEGQAAIAGLVVAAFVLSTQSWLPAWVIIPLSFLICFAGGMLWAFIPAWLQAWRGSHLVITTIMFNFIASAISLWLILDFMVLPGNQAPESASFIDEINVWRIDSIIRFFGINIGQTPANVSFFLAILTAVGTWFYLFRTRLGFELRVTGAGRDAGRFAGIPVNKTIMLSVVISGGLAGLMAFNEVVAVTGKVQAGFTAGFGFVGIAVSLMGRNNPLGIIPAALLFGFLFQGGTELSFEMPSVSRDMTVLIQGLIILFAGALPAMMLPILRKITYLAQLVAPKSHASKRGQ